ncbi:MAG: hypothetical protein R6V49_09120, partial [Bacteroidales bacterium]
MKTQVFLFQKFRKTRVKNLAKAGIFIIMSIIMMVSFPRSADAQLSVIIGTGTTSSATVGPTYISSSSSSYYWSNHISIFTPAEINALGAILTGMSWEKSNTEGYTLNNAEFKIYVKHTNISSIPSTSGTFATELSGATLMYESYTQNLPLASGWTDFMFNTINSFIYNGIDNLMVLVEWYRPGAPTSAVPWYYTSGVTGLAQTWSGSTTPPTIGYGSGSRPNIKLHYMYPGITNDAGILSIDAPTFPSTPGLHDVKTTITTLGSDTLTSCTINWSVNGITQTPYSWTGSLVQFQTDGPITIGSYNFPQGINDILVWTTNPNNAADSFPANDSASVSFLFTNPLSGTYTIGGINPDYATFNDAVTALDAGGISGPVTFNAAPGVYNEQLILTDVAGSSPVNTIVFQSSTGDSTDVILQSTLNSVSEAVILFSGAQYFTF